MRSGLSSPSKHWPRGGGDLLLLLLLPTSPVTGLPFSTLALIKHHHLSTLLFKGETKPHSSVQADLLTVDQSIIAPVAASSARTHSGAWSSCGRGLLSCPEVSPTMACPPHPSPHEALYGGLSEHHRGRSGKQRQSPRGSLHAPIARFAKLARGGRCMRGKQAHSCQQQHAARLPQSRPG